MLASLTIIDMDRFGFVHGDEDDEDAMEIRLEEAVAVARLGDLYAARDPIDFAPVDGRRDALIRNALDGIVAPVDAFIQNTIEGLAAIGGEWALPRRPHRVVCDSWGVPVTSRAAPAADTSYTVELTMRGINKMRRVRGGWEIYFNMVQIGAREGDSGSRQRMLQRFLGQLQGKTFTHVTLRDACLSRDVLDAVIPARGLRKLVIQRVRNLPPPIDYAALENYWDMYGPHGPPGMDFSTRVAAHSATLEELELECDLPQAMLATFAHRPWPRLRKLRLVGAVSAMGSQSYTPSPRHIAVFVANLPMLEELEVVEEVSPADLAAICDAAGPRLVVLDLYGCVPIGALVRLMLRAPRLAVLRGETSGSPNVLWQVARTRCTHLENMFGRAPPPRVEARGKLLAVLDGIGTRTPLGGFLHRDGDNAIMWRVQGFLRS